MYDSCEKSNTLPESSCRKYQVNMMMEDDYSIPTTSHYYQRQIIEGADSFGFEYCSNGHCKENGKFRDIYTRTAKAHTDSEGSLSARTSKKNSPYNKVLKISSSCNLSQELASTIYDATGTSAVYKKTVLKKPVELSFQETKPYKSKNPKCIRNENRVMFMEQGNFGKYNYDQYSSQGSSCAPTDSVRCRGRSESSRQAEKTTNCRPVPNVHCKEVTSATVERNARLQKLVKKIAKMRQKERQVHQWNNYIESLKSKHQSETMDNTSMRTDYINKKFTDEMSGTDVIEKGNYMRVSVRRSEATSVRTTPPFDPDAPGGACYQNFESLTMPCNFDGYGFYQNPPCFYPMAYPAMPQYPQYPQYAPQPQQPLLQYYQLPSLESKWDASIEAPQDFGSNMPKTNNVSSVSKKKYFLVHTSMQTNTDFGMQACESRENETNTDRVVSAETTNDVNRQSATVIAELRTMSKNIEKLKKKSHTIKSQEASLTSIEEKLDALLHSINNFMAKMKLRATMNPTRFDDESHPTCSCSSSPNNDNSVLASSRTTPIPIGLTELSKNALTCPRTRPPQKKLTCDKGILICSRTLLPRNIQTCDKSSNNIASKIVATRSEPHRVTHLEELVCHVMASAGDSFTLDEMSKGPSSSRSKLDIIRSLLEEIENNRVTRDTDSTINKVEKNRDSNPLSYEIPKKECWTITDSLSMTPLIEQNLEEVCLQSSTKDFYKHSIRQGQTEQRIMSVAVNTDPLSILSLIRVSKDAVKQILSYMPQIDSLIPRYLDCSSFFWQTSNRGVPHFSCNICGAAFMRPSQLSDHIASHNMGAVRNCCVCRHVLNSDHPRGRSRLFPCRYCGEHFTRAYCCQLHQQACAHLHGVESDVKPSLALLK